MRSIERYLLAWIMGALGLGALLMALLIYLFMLDEVKEVYEVELKNVAVALLGVDAAARLPQAGSAGPVPGAKHPVEEDNIVLLVWTLDGRPVYSSDADVKIAFSSIDGRSYLRIGDEAWTVYTSVQPGGVTQAAQRSVTQEHAAQEAVIRLLPPMLGLMVVVGGLLVVALRRALRPLGAAARGVASRSAKSLSRISTDGMPSEIEPLVASTNDLMSRLAEALNVQRRFLADAAHELRSPVTALRLQLQLLQRASDDASRAKAGRELESGIDRTQHLIEQLLQVARTEPDGEVTRDEPVSLSDLVRSVVGQLSSKAERLDIDLGATGAIGVTVRGDSHQLTILLNNLVENALRYTPAGGVVDVDASLHDGRPTLAVIDNGPGIAPLERERVFNRFHRGEHAQANARDAGGSGLGLAIVRAIADRHQAVVSLDTPDAGKGLAARVVFAHGSAVADTIPRTT